MVGIVIATTSLIVTKSVLVTFLWLAQNMHNHNLQEDSFQLMVLKGSVHSQLSQGKAWLKSLEKESCSHLEISEAEIYGNIQRWRYILWYCTHSDFPLTKFQLITAHSAAKFISGWTCWWMHCLHNPITFQKHFCQHIRDILGLNHNKILKEFSWWKKVIAG